MNINTKTKKIGLLKRERDRLLEAESLLLEISKIADALHQSKLQEECRLASDTIARITNSMGISQGEKDVEAPLFKEEEKKSETPLTEDAVGVI